MELLVSIGDLFDFTQKDHFWKFCEDDLEEGSVTFVQMRMISILFIQ